MQGPGTQACRHTQYDLHLITDTYRNEPTSRVPVSGLAFALSEPLLCTAAGRQLSGAEVLAEPEKYSGLYQAFKTAQTGPGAIPPIFVISNTGQLQLITGMFSVGRAVIDKIPFIDVILLSEADVAPYRKK